MSDKNFKVKNGIDANGTITVSSFSDSASNLTINENVSTRTNLVLNPVFAVNDTTGWGSYFQSTNTIITDATAPYGTKVLQIQIPKDANPHGAIWLANESQQANIAYSVSAYVKGPAGVQGEFSGRPTLPDLSYLSEGSSPLTFTFTGSWQRIYFTYTPPVAYRTGFQLTILPTQYSSTMSFYMHGVVVEYGSTTNLPYFDGSQNAYADKYRATTAWSGTANLSKSTVTYISQTANALEVKGNSSTVAKIDPYGTLTISASATPTSINGQYGNLTVRSTTLADSLNAAAYINTGYAPGIGLVLRGYGSQTADLQQWQYSDGTTYAKINPYGQLAIGNANPAIYANARISLNTVATDAVGLVIRGVSSQTASLQEWQNSAGTVLGFVKDNGYSASIAGLNYIYTYAISGWNGVGGAISFANATGITITPQSASVQSLIVKGVASQTANLQEWQNSAGTVLASISPTGKLTSAVDASINGMTLGWGGGQDYHNLAFGYTALNNNTTGQLNMAMGYRALQSNTTGWNNMSLGADSLTANTTGQANTAIGAQALYSNTSGGENTAIGNWALLGGNGGWNTAIGASSMNQNSGSAFNTAVGRASLYSISTGAHNTAIGQQASGAITTGNSNSILGSEALISLTTGNSNIAIGRDAGHSVVTGSANIFLGYQAGYSETGSNKLYIANSNTATPLIGGDFSAKTLDVAGNATITSQATGTVGLTIQGAASQSANLQEWKDGSGNLVGYINNGAGAWFSNSIGINATPYAYSAMVSINTANAGNKGLVVRGYASQTADLQQWQNSAGTTLSKIDKDGNIITGYATSSILAGGGRAIIDGYGAIFTVDTLTVGSTSDRFAAGAVSIIHRSGNATDLTFGIKAMASQTGDLTQWRNSANTVLAKVDSIGNATFNTVYVGLGAGAVSSNIAIGGSTLSSNTTGFGNSAIGLNALQSNTTGWGNTGIGTYALQYYSGNVNTGIGYSALRNATAEGLVAIGFGALQSNTSGNSNTAAGYFALGTNIIGAANTAFGSQSSRLSTGDRNTSLGFYSAYNLTTGTDNVFIGSQAGQSFTTGSANIAIGAYNSWYQTSTGSNNTFIGHDGGGKPVTGSNNTTLGYQASISSSSISNEITLGNSSVAIFRIPGTGFISDTSKTYSAKELDLRDVSTQFTNTGTGSIGQKINLWGGIYGIGVESAALVNYIPSAASFVIKSTYGGGALFSVSGTGAATFSADLTVSGNLTVNGTTTNLNSTNLVIEDKNIIIADVATPTDTTADGAGITIKGATDKSLTWSNSTKSFTSSEPVIVDGTTSTTIPLLVKVPTAQTTNSFEVQDSRGYSMFRVIAPAGGTAYNNGAIWIRPWGTGNVAAMGTDSYQGFYFVSPATSSINFGTGGGGKAFEIVVNDTFNRYKVEGKGTGVAPIFTTNGNDTDVNMHIYPKGAGKIGINTTTPTGYVHVVSSSSSVVGLIVQSVASQTANLQEWHNSSGTVLAAINPVGQFFTGLTPHYATVSTTTAASGDGSTATITTTSAHNIAVGDFILVSGITPVGYNGTYLVTAVPTSTQISYANTTTGSQTVAGSILMSAQASITARSNTSVGLTVKAGANASAQTWQNSSGAQVARVDNTGNIVVADVIANNLNAPFGYALIGTSYSRFSTAMISVKSTTAASQGIIVRGAASQTANLQEWQDSDGSVLGGFNAYGSMYISNQVQGGTAQFGNMGYASASQVVLKVQGVNSQTANLQEWQNSSGTVLALVEPTGNAKFPLVYSQYYTSTNNAGSYIELTGYTTYIRQRLTNQPNLVVSGTASQTANLQEWQNSAGTVLSRVRPDGQIGIGQTLITSTNFFVNNSISTTHVVATIRGAVSQTADLQQWQNSGGTTIASVDTYGNAGFGGVGANSNQGLYVKTNSNPAVIGIIVQGAASQTASLQEWRNSAGTVLTKVDNLGNFTAISKSFDIIHPTKENMRLRYGSLEGPENGVYIRGTAESNIIELPEYWTGLVHEDSITASLTAVGSAQNIYVEKIENNKIYIGGNLEKAFFTVYGERKDIDKLTVEY